MKQEAKLQSGKEREKAGEDIAIMRNYVINSVFHNDEYKLRNIFKSLFDGLEYGIGIHIESMKHSLKHYI